MEMIYEEIDKVLDEDPRMSNEHPQINVLKVVIRPGSQGESQFSNSEANWSKRNTVKEQEQW